MSWHSIVRVGPALALGAVLAIAGPSYARGGGGHGGGGHGGGGHGGGFGGRGGGWGGGRGYYGGGRGYYGGGGYYGGRGYYGRGYYGYGGYGGYYPWYGYGLGGYGYGYGGYYPSYYYGNSYYNNGSYPYDYYSYPASTYTATPANGYQSMYPTAQQNPNAVRLNVWVPVANAKVWIDNSPTQQTGTYRTFETPPLTRGSDYSYTIRGQWTENGKTVDRSQTVHFHTGEQVNVNLTVPTASGG